MNLDQFNKIQSFLSSKSEDPWELAFMVGLTPNEIKDYSEGDETLKLFLRQYTATVSRYIQFKYSTVSYIEQQKRIHSYMDLPVLPRQYYK